MIQSIIYSAELSLFLPIHYENTVSNELTPWIRAGVTNSSICHIFDVDLDNNCPSYVLSNSASTSQYIAIGLFQIAALKKINKYKTKLSEILTSNNFLNTFNKQMNIKLSNYTLHRRLISLQAFKASRFAIFDQNFSDEAVDNPSSEIVILSTNVNFSKSQNTDDTPYYGAFSFICDDESGVFAVVIIISGVLLLMLISILCTVCGIVYYKCHTKSNPNDTMDRGEVHDHLEMVDNNSLMTDERAAIGHVHVPQHGNQVFMNEEQEYEQVDIVNNDEEEYEYYDEDDDGDNEDRYHNNDACDLSKADQDTVSQVIDTIKGDV